ncbi:MAG: COX15/CtaA family protein, partial [Gemmatimonadota bacterium]
MSRPQHSLAFLITVFWTLGLLLLGSIVHATESSLACPDWPTCNGTLVPEMTGGVFWEHLHRLVAGGLIVFFFAATYLVWKEKSPFRWILWASWVGIGLLLVQAVLGGITVLFLLPDAISTSHLGLAFFFLGLTTVLAVVSSPSWNQGLGPATPVRRTLRTSVIVAWALAFGQSLVGAAVRHTEAGMACPDVPLCLGEWIPPFSHPIVVLHFGHRLLGLVVWGAVLWVGHMAFWRGGSPRVRLLGSAAALVTTAQVMVGFLSVYVRLDVVPVSLHTLLAATLVSLLAALAALT